MITVVLLPDEHYQPEHYTQIHDGQVEWTTEMMYCQVNCYGEDGRFLTF